MSTRLEALRAMLAQDPKSTFVHYGLAMELLNTGQTAESIAAFDSLLAVDPDYSAAYFHGGRALEAAGRLDEARQLYRRGIAVTEAKGDDHTRAELEGALALLS